MVDWLGALNHSSDSVFVRDFYVASCYVGDSWTYYSHNLDENENKIKKGLRVKFVKFQDKKDFRWDNPEENKYRLVYHTWAQYFDPWTPSSLFNGLFTTTQIEHLKIDNKDYYEREVRYKWVLFFWVQSFELVNVRTKASCQQEL